MIENIIISLPRVRGMADVKEKLRATIRQVYAQVTNGCGRPVCTNPNCASNPEMGSVGTQQEAQRLSIELGSKILSNHQEAIKLCEKAPPFFTLASIQQIMEKAAKENDYVPVRRFIGEVFAHNESLNQSFLHEGLMGVACTEQSGVNYKDAEEGLGLLGSSEVSDLYYNTVSRALTNLKQDLRYSKSSFESPVNLRQFIVLLQDPSLFDPFRCKLFFVPFTSCIAALPEQGLKILKSWMKDLGLEKLKFFLTTVQSMLSMRALQEDLVPILHKDEDTHGAAEFLHILYDINKELNEPISYLEFYNDVINERLLDIDELAENFIIWQKNLDRGGNQFTLCSYIFMLDPYTKSRVLLFDSKVQQFEHRQGFLNRGYFVLRVEREHLIGSALAQMELHLIHDPSVFKRQLKVKFEGEEGIDEGGLQKEFFQLIIKELFDEKFGMFTWNKESNRYWISHTSEDTKEFLLIGLILGLAIYNGVILDIHFPKVLYKKLMGISVGFDDVKEVEPTVWKNLNELHEYSGDDMEEVFGLNFQVMYDYYGHSNCYNLIENGDSVLVNQSNKEKYIELYTKWILEVSVEKQFEAFLKGFKYVCTGLFFEIFRVEEVELLICGDPELDFKDLENVTHYDGGFDVDHEVIKNFWEVIHSLNEEEQKKFLFFTTGSDRAPIGGLKNLRFIITKHGDDSDRLPGAHTCFNVLLLPPYATKEKLREKLLLATENATGFGML
uniref:HECT-type E3 ubiquitin transferase n=1 Tax=Vannella robusta TaxID=1487602 RepID=A0A7S4I2I9_9EUKA|mmetsp:Transcript_19551/g.24675  ORF Transcript_19551/g.24675 Transcript_19551/m.24675 type:complete len:726 (+) Transcript_19551:52-2229(+)